MDGLQAEAGAGVHLFEVRLREEAYGLLEGVARAVLNDIDLFVDAVVLDPATLVDAGALAFDGVGRHEGVGDVGRVEEVLHEPSLWLQGPGDGRKCALAFGVILEVAKRGEEVDGAVGTGVTGGFPHILHHKLNIQVGVGRGLAGVRNGIVGKVQARHGVAASCQFEGVAATPASDVENVGVRGGMSEPFDEIDDLPGFILVPVLISEFICIAPEPRVVPGHAVVGTVKRASGWGTS